jgi:4-diphosphocytidyl-2-C-methyl-D-erythritol kinase
MVCFPNAKINLGLNILEKRPDGFHNIETVFYPIPLADILEIIPDSPSGKTEMKITGLTVPGEVVENLCLKAYRILQAVYNLPPVRIILHKLIPMGAGLGGGSSDGAFVLTTLNRMFELGLSDECLMDYASQLGSDCAFFIKNKAAIGVGRGNELKTIEVSLRGYYLVLVKPEIHVGTAEAYAGVKPFRPLQTSGTLVLQPINEWKKMMVNDFESSIFLKHTEIQIIKEKLYDTGAVYASMTGSGAAVYGIFRDEIDFKDIFKNYFAWGSRL